MDINYCHLLCCNETFNSTSNCSLYVDEMGLAMLDEMTTPSEFIFIILTLHSMIFVIGVLGNTSICYTIYLVSRKKPIKVTHFFIASMAVSDILMAIFCAPMRQLNSLVLMAIFCAPLRQLNSLVLIAIFCAPLRQLNSLIFKEWLFEITICSLVQFLKWCLIVQKSFIMVVISSDRNYIVTRPLKQRMKKRTAHIIVCVTYVMAIIVCVAYVMAIIVCVTYVMAMVISLSHK
jgi:hypothetical protein